MKNTQCNKGNIHLVGVEKKYQSKVLTSSREALESASRLLKYKKNVDVAIFDAEDWDVHSKLTLSAHARVYFIDIKICFYRKNLELKKLFTIDLPSTIHHEMAHVVRINTVGYAETLLEDFIDEGIACFVEESLGLEQQISYIAEIENEKKLIEEAKKLLNERLTGSLHQKWFWGTEELPDWTGYRIGYLIVKSFMEKNKVSLDVLVRTKAKEIFEKSGI